MLNNNQWYCRNGKKNTAWNISNIKELFGGNGRHTYNAILLMYTNAQMNDNEIEIPQSLANAEFNPENRECFIITKKKLPEPTIELNQQKMDDRNTRNSLASDQQAIVKDNNGDILPTDSGENKKKPPKKAIPGNGDNESDDESLSDGKQVIKKDINGSKLRDSVLIQPSKKQKMDNRNTSISPKSKKNVANTPQKQNQETVNPSENNQPKSEDDKSTAKPTKSKK